MQAYKMSTFENLSSMKRGLMRLDRAVSKKVKVEGEAKFDDGYQAVYNIDKKQRAMITSSKYSIVQHKEVFDTFIDAVQDLNLRGFGTVWNTGNRVVAEISFKGKTIEDPTAGHIAGDDASKGKNILLGVRLTNSYDKSLSIRGQLFAYREACANGMFLGKEMKELQVMQKHIGKIDLTKKMEKFIREIVNSQERLQAVVSETMKDTLEWEMAYRVLRHIFEKRHTKHVEGILSQLGISVITEKDKKTKEVKYQYVWESKKTQPKKVNRWQLYNAITGYLTHHEKLTPFMREKLNDCGAKMLKPSHELIAMVEK